MSTVDVSPDPAEVPPSRGAGTGWAWYVGKRLFAGVGVLWAAFTVSFIVLYLLPSDPIQIMLSGSGTEFVGADDAKVAEVRAEYGLDRSAPAQYLAALGGALTLDFGRSIQRGMPVTELLGDALGQTLLLGGLALTLALVIGFAVAVTATLAPWRPLRQAVLGLPALSVSIPTFWSGLLITQVFAFGLQWVNVFDTSSFATLLLPATTLAIPVSAFIAQILAKSLATTMREPYVEVVRSRGVSEARVVVGSALRNASLPLLTMLGMIVGNIIAGSVVVETVFSRMGIGRITFEAVKAQDIPVVMGVVMIAATAFVLINLLVDIVYPLLDPRVDVGIRRRSAAITGEGIG